MAHRWQSVPRAHILSFALLRWLLRPEHSSILQPFQVLVADTEYVAEQLWVTGPGLQPGAVLAGQYLTPFIGHLALEKTVIPKDFQ